MNKIIFLNFFLAFFLSVNAMEKEVESSVGLVGLPGNIQADRFNSQPAIDKELIFAVTNGNKDQVLKLLKLGANRNAFDLRGKTVKEIAKEKYFDEIANLLEPVSLKEQSIKAVAKQIGKTLTIEQAKQKLPTELWEELEKYLAKNSVDLKYAVVQNNINQVKQLLELGVDINHNLGGGILIKGTMHLDFTPLMWAAYFGNKEIVELLLKAGTRVDIKDSEGATASDIAIMQGHPEIAQLIKEKTTLKSLFELSKQKVLSIEGGKEALEEIKTELPPEKRP